MDLRAEELATLKAIYGEGLVLTDEGLEQGHEPVPGTAFSGAVHVPIALESPLQVSQAGVSHPLLYLPPVKLEFDLPVGYPYERCAEIGVVSDVLPEKARRCLEDELRALWHDTRDQVLFSMVDHLQERLLDPLLFLAEVVGVLESETEKDSEPSERDAKKTKERDSQEENGGRGSGQWSERIEKAGERTEKAGNERTEKAGDEKAGDEKAGDEKAGDEKAGNQKAGDENSKDPEIRKETPVVLARQNVYIQIGSDARLVQQLVDHNSHQMQHVFNTSTFECGICQENAFGSQSFQFAGCKHVFCMQCLGDFFSSLIQDANVDKVHCPDFECTRQIAQERDRRVGQRITTGLDFDVFKSELMTPPISLVHLKRILEHSQGESAPKSPSSEQRRSHIQREAAGQADWDPEGPKDASRDLYEKYLALFLDHQHNLMAKLFPGRLVTCAGLKCTNMIFRPDVAELLVVCRKCGYAFCNNCRKSNHSKTRGCTGVRAKREYFGVSEADLEVWAAPKSADNMAQKERLRKTFGSDLLRKLALDYDMDKMDRMFSQLIAEGDFSRCPTCDLVVQRSDGCNKMKCSACYSFFCNVCGAFLPPDTPYEHYNDKASSCYGKLFHGMPGAEDP